MSSIYKIRKATRINDSTSTTTKTTGALIVDGGISSGNNIVLGGYLGITGTNNNVISLTANASTGAYNFNLPTTSGSSSDVLTSAGGGSSPMTWSTCTGTSNIVRSNGPTFGASTVTFGGPVSGITTLSTSGLITASGGLTSTGTTTLGTTNISNANLTVLGSISISPTSGVTLQVSSTTSSSTTNSSNSIYTLGGIGVTGDSIFSGIVNFNNATASTSSTTGALLVSGGVGISGLINQNYTDVLSGDITLASFLRTGTTGTPSISIKVGVSNTAKNCASIDFGYLGSNLNTSYLRLGLQGQTGMQIFGNNNVNITSTTASTSSITGALVVSGGVGISGNSSSFASGIINITNSSSTPQAMITALAGSMTAGQSNIILLGQSATTFMSGHLTFICSSTSPIATSNALYLTLYGSGVGFSVDGAANTATPGTSHVFGPSSSTNTNTLITIQNNSSSRLEIVHVGNNANFSSTAVVGDSVIRSNSGNLILQTGGSNGAIRINTSNNVEILPTTASTSTTTGALVVSGGVGISGNINVGFTASGQSSSFLYPTMATGNNVGIWLGKATSTKNALRLVYSHSGGDGSNSNYFSFDFNGQSNVITGSAAGNVGIGTTTPVSRLHLASNASLFDSLLTISESTHISSRRAGIQLGGWIVGQDLGSSGLKDFFFYDNNTANTRFYIGIGGNIGIGTGSPSAQLNVNNDFTISANSATWNSTAGKGIFMRYSTFSGNDGAYIQSVTRSASETFHPMFIMASSLSFSTNSSTERFSISTTGVVSITSTTASTTTTTGALTVAGGVGIVGTLTVGGNINLGPTADNNANYFIRSAGQIFISANDASSQDANNTSLFLSSGVTTNQSIINIVGSSTGKYISFSTSNTERMRIESTGNLTITGEVTASKKMQSGSGNITFGGLPYVAAGVTFPVAFNVSPIVVTNNARGDLNGSIIFSHNTRTTSGFVVVAHTSDGTSSTATFEYTWIAIAP